MLHGYCFNLRIKLKVYQKLLGDTGSTSKTKINIEKQRLAVEGCLQSLKICLMINKV